MIEKTFETSSGSIRYWVSKVSQENDAALVFLPGLTADHRLFDKQIEYFIGNFNVLVWDAPGHGASWPFELSFSLLDEARWLDGILAREELNTPIFVGQSMGGYVVQAYAQLYPDKLYGFVSIDSAPLQRSYMSGAELWMLKHMESIYRYYPWSLLVKSGSNGVATSAYGRRLMQDMMRTYEGDKDRYIRLCGHGYRMLAQAIEDDLPYELRCPALLICGKRDRVGSCIRYNKRWHQVAGLPLEWIADAGHNSNTDAPDVVNGLIDGFVRDRVL